MTLERSVIIPTHRRREELARCLAALAPETQGLASDRYEVIVCDDAAGGDAAAAPELAARFPWVRWVAGPGRGVAANRNSGAAAARSDWLVFVDDDCVPDPGWLQAYLGEGFEPGRVHMGRTDCREGQNWPRWVAPVVQSASSFVSCNYMIDRATFDRLGGFDERFCFPGAVEEDTEFGIRLAKQGVALAFVSEASVNHPPRRVPNVLRARLNQWRSRVLLQAIHPDQPREFLPLHVAKLRVVQRNIPSSVPTWCFAGFLALVEVIAVAWSHRRWCRWAEGLSASDVRARSRRQKAPEPIVLAP